MNLARASQHLMGLEKLYTEGLMKTEGGRPSTKAVAVLPNLRMAEHILRTRKEMISIAETLPR